MNIEDGNELDWNSFLNEDLSGLELLTTEDFESMISNTPPPSTVPFEDYSLLKERFDRLTNDFYNYRSVSREGLEDVKRALKKSRSKVDSLEKNISDYMDFTQINPMEMERLSSKDIRPLKTSVQRDRMALAEELRLLKYDAITIEAERGFLAEHLKVIIKTMDLLEQIKPEQRLLKEKFIARLRRFESYK